MPIIIIAITWLFLYAIAWTVYIAYQNIARLYNELLIIHDDVRRQLEARIKELEDKCQ